MNTENLLIPEGYIFKEKLNTGYIVSKGNIRVFIPYNYTENTTTTIYRPGSGSLGDDYYYVKEGLNNGGDQVVVMLSGTSADDNSAKNTTYHKQDQQLYGIANEIQETLGITSNSIAESGYSMSYDASLKGAANYAISNPNASAITINLIDGGRGSEFGDPGLVHVKDLTKEQLQALAKNGATVNLFERSNEMNNSNITDAVKYLTENGIDVNVYYGADDHGLQRNNAMTSGVLTSTPDYSGYKEVSYSGKQTPQTITSNNTSSNTNNASAVSNQQGTATNSTTSSGTYTTNNSSFQNVDLSKYVAKEGKTATKYIIPANAPMNDSGYDIEVIIPNNKSNISGLYGQIGSSTWNNCQSALLNENEGAVAVKLMPAGGQQSMEERAITAEDNMKIMDVVGKITGQKEAGIVGASYTSLFALDAAAESVSSSKGHYVKVTKAGWVDYLPEGNYDFITALEKMKEGNVEFIGITDTDISKHQGTGKAAIEYYSRGENAIIYQYLNGSHPEKCWWATLAFMGVSASGIPSLYQYTKFDENGNMIITKYDSKTIKQDNNGNNEEQENSDNNNDGVGDDIVSVDYQFVSDSLNNIFALINSISITNLGTVGIMTSGSATYDAVNTIFNDYANQSIEFLNSLGITCGNILTIAESMKEVDSVLDESILSTGAEAITSVELLNYSEFYKKIPKINMISKFEDSGGILKITKEDLFSIMSDSNIIISSLTKDILETQKLKSELDTFINDSNNYLKGPAWDSIRGKLNEYSEISQQKIDYAKNLIISMKESYQKLLNHMEEFDILDMAQMDEIKQGISDLKNQIAALEYLIETTPDYEDIVEYDPTTGDWKVTGQISHIAEKESWRETKQLCEKVKAKLEKNLQKLEELPSVDQSAAENITGNVSNEPEHINTNAISSPSVSVAPIVELDNSTPLNNQEQPNVNAIPSPTISNKTEEITNNLSNQTQQNQNNQNSNMNSIVSNKNEESISNIGEQPTQDENEVNNNLGLMNANNENMQNNNNNLINPNEKQESNVQNIQTQQNANTVEKESNSNVLNTIGIIGGLVGTAGAAAYGVKKYNEKKNENYNNDYIGSSYNNEEEVNDTGLDDFN